MNTPRDEQDLDALLRQPSERLAPPDGSWELVTRRARRRRWAKASVAVAASVVVVAAAVPAVYAVRHSSDDQSLEIANGHTPTPHQTAKLISPAPVPSSASPIPVPANLTGYFPESVSFISQTDGYAWGTVGSSSLGVVAHTADGGLHWTRLSAPHIDDAFATVRHNADGQIRFGSPTVGFIFGAKYFVTQDSGALWTQFKVPGYIDDLEVMHDRVWALVRPSRTSSAVSLYSATVDDPTLRQVTAVPTMHSVPGADSIAVNKTSVSVIAGSAAFYNSANGVKWRPAKDPCAADLSVGSVQSALLTTLNLGDVIAACGYNVRGGTEDKRVFVSATSGKRWAPTAGNPATSGHLETIAAGTNADLIIGTNGGGAQITHDGGTTWSPDAARGIELGFVGFIDPAHIVAVTDRTDGFQGAFATSYDAGATWTVTPFPK